MPQNSSRRSAERLAVLHLTPESAEWLDPCEPGAVRYARVPVLGATPADLASAADQARTQAGGARRRCVLALGGKLVEQRVLGLPELPRRDLERVLPRKAANLLGVDAEQALYCALALAHEQRTDNEAGTESKWFLLAMRRSLITPLTHALHKSGFEIERLVSPAMARLCFAQGLRADPAAPCIVVDVDTDCVVVSLIQSDELRMQNRLHGGFEATPTMAMTLIQEVKTFDAFWRKVSRGEGVKQVVVLGMDVERSRLFANAILTALPGAAVRVRPDETDELEAPEQRALTARVLSLSACCSTGSLALEASLPTPPKLALVAGVAGAALLVTGSIGAVMRDSLARELHALRSARMSMDALSGDLVSLSDSNRRTQALLDELQLETDRLVARLEWGAPLEPTLEALVGVVDGQAQLRSFSLQRFGSQGEVRFSGVAPAEPLEAVRALKTIESGLERCSTLANVRVSPLEIRGRLEPGEGAPFDGAASWETAR
jgi:hypothetical protein